MRPIVVYRILALFCLVFTVVFLYRARYRIEISQTMVPKPRTPHTKLQFSEPLLKKQGKLLADDWRPGPWLHNSKFEFVLNNADMCFSKDEIFVVVMVASSPGNFNRRKFVRETWGNPTLINGKEVRTVFVLGLTESTTIQNKINVENLHFGDIVQQNFTDSYNNLTLKTLASLQWARWDCPNARFVMKTDDDALVIYKNLVQYLTSLTKKEAHLLYVGDIHKRTKPIRNVTDKWHLTRKEFPLPTLPPYHGGSGYVLSMGAVRKVLDSSKSTRLVHIEDVYIGICAKKAGIKATSHIGFSGYWYTYSYCRYRDLITTHGWKIKDMRRIWEQVIHPRNIPTKCPPFEKLMMYWDYTEEEVWIAMEEDGW